MEPRHFSAHELMEMIQSKATYADLAEKYGLTAHQLDEVLAKLVEKGMVKAEELPKKGEGSAAAMKGTTSPGPAIPLHKPTPTPVFTCTKCGASQPYHFDECPVCGAYQRPHEGIVSELFHAVTDGVSHVIEEVERHEQEKAEQARRQEQARHDAIQQQLEQWVRNGIPEVDVPVMLKKGEVGHYTSPVEVLQQKTQTDTYRTYIGTRSSLFKVPLYFGASMPHKSSHEVMASVGSGTFTITSQRVVLTGAKINYSVAFGKINGIQLYSDAVQLFDEGAKGGRFYKVNDPQRVAMILGVLLNRG